MSGKELWAEVRGSWKKCGGASEVAYCREMLLPTLAVQEGKLDIHEMIWRQMGEQDRPGFPSARGFRSRAFLWSNIRGLIKEYNFFYGVPSVVSIQNNQSAQELCGLSIGQPSFSSLPSYSLLRRNLSANTSAPAH